MADNRWMSTRFHSLTAVAFMVIAVQLVPVTAQPPTPRFWLAGRYDGNHIIVFFDAVKFNGTVPRTARPLAIPTTVGFLFQRELSASYVAQLPKEPGAEQFHAGDQYDLLLDDGRVVTVTLTTLVGYVSDDEDDDPSYIGALAKVYDATALGGPQSYYVLRRHEASAVSRKAQPTSASESRFTESRTFARLLEEPVRFDLQMQIAKALTERVRIMATAQAQRQTENVAPTLAVQAFCLADGELRYYARAEWRTEGKIEGPPAFALGAWLAPQPVLQILAVEKITSPYGFLYELPNLLNVVDLGAGRTGIIADISGPGDTALGLWQYQEGADLNHMHLFQSLVMDE